MPTSAIDNYTPIGVIVVAVVVVVIIIEEIIPAIIYKQPTPIVIDVTIAAILLLFTIFNH